MAYAKHYNHQERSSRFKEIADKITEIAAKYSVSVKGYHSPELPLFNSLSSEKQTLAIEDSGARLDNQEKSLWGALSTLGFVPPSDLFHRFESDDAIELYDLNGIQIWRNLNTMKICSYTLEEVYSIEWFKRYVRDAEISRNCESHVGALLTGNSEIHCVNLPEHVVEETCSSEGLIISLKINWLARFKNASSQLAGFMVVSKAAIIGKKVELTENKPALRLVEAFPPHLST
jgi:hypothetical protein